MISSGINNLNRESVRKVFMMVYMQYLHP